MVYAVTLQWFITAHCLSDTNTHCLSYMQAVANDEKIVIMKVVFKFTHVVSFHYTNTCSVTSSSLCRCAEGQGTGSLQHPTVTPALGQWVGLIPNLTPLQRKSELLLVCWERQTPHQSGDACGDLGSYGNRQRYTTECHPNLCHCAVQLS